MADQSSEFDLDRDELRERYGYEPGEREAIERNIAARQHKIDADEMLAWAAARTAARNARPAEPVVKDYHRAELPQHQVRAPETLSQQWVNYIAREIKRGRMRTMEIMTEALGETVIKGLVDVERRCEKLESELAAVKAELAETRGGPRLRAVAPFDKDSMIA